MRTIETTQPLNVVLALSGVLHKAQYDGAFNNPILDVIDSVIDDELAEHDASYAKYVARLSLLAAVADEWLNSPLSTRVPIANDALTKLLSEPLCSFVPKLTSNDRGRLSAETLFVASAESGDLDTTSYNMVNALLLDECVDSLRDTTSVITLIDEMRDSYKCTPFSLWRVTLEDGQRCIASRLGDYRILQWEDTFIKEGKYKEPILVDNVDEERVDEMSSVI